MRKFNYVSTMNLLDSSTDPSKIKQDAAQIEFTQYSVRFGNVIYQSCNLTGVIVGKISKDPFPLMLFLILVIGGLFTLPVFGLGLIPLGIALFIALAHSNKQQRYGLTLMLNSGHQDYFETTDKNFLGEIMEALKSLMDNNAQKVEVNMYERCVRVSGDFNGSLSNGDHKISALR